MTKLFIRIALVLSLPLGIASSATAQGSATATTPAKVTPVVAAKIVPSVPTSPSKGDDRSESTSDLRQVRRGRAGVEGGSIDNEIDCIWE